MATLAIGAILLVHAVVMVVLAFSTSTVTFLAVSRPLSWVIGIAGLVPLIWYIRHQARTPTPPGTSETPTWRTLLDNANLCDEPMSDAPGVAEPRNRRPRQGEAQAGGEGTTRASLVARPAPFVVSSPLLVRPGLPQF